MRLRLDVKNVSQSLRVPGVLAQGVHQPLVSHSLSLHQIRLCDSTQRLDTPPLRASYRTNSRSILAVRLSRPRGGTPEAGGGFAIR